MNDHRSIKVDLLTKSTMFYLVNVQTDFDHHCISVNRIGLILSKIV